MFKHFILMVFLAMALPLPAVAATETTIDLTDINEFKNWKAEYPESVNLESNGIRFWQQEKPGLLARRTKDIGALDEIEVTYSSTSSFDARFMWRTKGMKPGNFVQVPLALPASPNSATFIINTEALEKWTRTPEFIAFGLTTDGNIVLEKIVVRKYSSLERIAGAWRSFWKFDAFKGYTINLLKGPQLFVLPISYSGIFVNLPPPTRSVNSVFYVLLGLSVLIVVIFKVVPKLRTYAKKVTLFTLLCLAASWVFYDLRMGLELINYARQDYSQYIAAAPASKVFRTHEQFDVFAQETKEYTQGQDRYMFLTQERWPFLGKMRYYTYPSQPAEPDTAEETPNIWIVYHHYGVSVNEANELTVDGEVVSPPGEIIKQLAPSAFVFQVSS